MNEKEKEEEEKEKYHIIQMIESENVIRET